MAHRGASARCMVRPVRSRLLVTKQARGGQKKPTVCWRKPAGNGERHEDLTRHRPAHWSGHDVSVGEVVKAIEDLRRDEQRAATRTSVATLIIVSRSTDEVDDAETVIDHLVCVILLASLRSWRRPKEARREPHRCRRHPAHGHGCWPCHLVRRNPSACFRRTSHNLASLLRPMLLSDLPVMAWYVRGLPNAETQFSKLLAALLSTAKWSPIRAKANRPCATISNRLSQWCRKNVIVDLGVEPTPPLASAARRSVRWHCYPTIYRWRK